MKNFLIFLAMIVKNFLIFLVIIAVFITGVFVAAPNNPLFELMRDPGGIGDDSGNSRVGATILSSYSGSYALLIGESRYVYRWNNLSRIPGELQKVEKLLIAQGFTVKTALNLTARQLKDTVEKFIDDYGFDENNRLLFFYSGHGYSSGKRGYIVPIDAPNPDFDNKGFLQKAITMDQILAWARRMTAKHALFLFDSCFAGTVFAAKEKPIPPRQISQAAALPVRQFITAGSAKESVPAKSVFTPAFVDALKEGWGDMNKDGYITGMELGLYLQGKVPKHTEQTPQFGKITDYDLAQGDFVFVVGGGTVQAVDNDNDGVIEDDRCPNNRVAELTHGVYQQGANRGCPLDSDQDGVADYQDRCPYNRPAEIAQRVESNGCPTDSDRDGVADYRDRCRYNRPNEIVQGVNSQGCPVDRDSDQVADYQDDCPITPSGISVDKKGCPISNKVLATMPSGRVFRDRLKDGRDGPEMVVISAGRFRMGDIQGGGHKWEQPVHSVSVEKFAMGRYEVTVGEFRRFVNATGYQTDAEKQGKCYTWVGDSSGKNWHNLGFSQKDTHPVVCVSWNDATAYTEWLSQQTGHTYRLPTEAQWEYAARAGTETKYWWGNDIGTNRANCYRNSCGDSFEYTAPVGSFAPNPFGLYDTAGNVWEWTCSEFEGKYAGKEQLCADGGSRFALRGGSWSNFRGTCEQLTATGTRMTTAATAWGSASPGLLRFGFWTF